MGKGACLLVLMVFFILGLSNFSCVVKPEQVTLEYSVYPGQSIQQAINSASEGDVILIESGVHREESYPIIVNKTLTLMGRNVENTIIDGQAASLQIFLIKAEGVKILKLTIQNTSDYVAAVHLSSVRDVEIAECKIKGSFSGIQLENSTFCNITKNEIVNNHAYGIYLQSNSSLNLIIGNMISNNPTGIFIADINSKENKIYHNNFVNNANQRGGVGVGGTWDNGYPSGGNYWSDYVGVDLKSGPHQNETGSDGIGDTPYPEPYPNALDNYPFTGIINFFNAGRWNEIDYYVLIASNSTISEFYFNPDVASIKYNVTSLDGELGFCRVAILKQMLWVEGGQQWIVLVNYTSVNPLVIDQYDEYTYLYFTYNQGTEVVPLEIRGTNAVPEFQEGIILMFLTLLLSATALAKIRSKQI
jgi:parallel beta-helix repeat protein